MNYDAQGLKMKAKDLLRNAIVLKTEGRKGLSSELSSLVREIELKGLSTLAAYVLAQLDNERDPVIGMMREASQGEQARKKLLGEAVDQMSAFNKVLNLRFAAPGTLLMNADDPGLAKVVAALPPHLIQGTRFRSTTLEKLDGVLRGKLPLASYLENLSQFARDQHQHKRANAETQREVLQGRDYNVFSRMAFLAHEQQNISAHAFRFEGKDGLRFAALKFTTQSEKAFAKTWYPQNIAKAYLFGHELGHCLTPNALRDESVQQYKLDGKHEELVFREELFADIYSACLMAKITGSWDFLALCVLPLRAESASTHNTYDTMLNLPKTGINPKSFQYLEDRDLVNAAENLFRELAPSLANTHRKPLHDAAGMMMSYSREGEFGDSMVFNEALTTALKTHMVEACPENEQLVTQLMMKRMQSEIDLIGMRAQMGVSAQWVRQALDQIATTVESSSTPAGAINLRRVATLGDEAMRSQLMSLMSHSAVGALENYELTAMSVDHFWEQWQQEEASLGKNQGPQERALDR